MSTGGSSGGRGALGGGDDYRTTDRDVNGIGGERPERSKRSARGDPALSTGRLTGVTIGERYQIVGLSGRGGLGRVFRVKHTMLGKHFALKLMNAHLHDDPQRRDLFYREAKVASALMHPNVVSVVDFGEDEVAGAFMVMEYLDGESLTERLRRHPRGVPIKVFCDVMLQLAEALHYIHTQGVVHGDIKSDNVICSRIHGSSRRQWQIKLLDFGLAFQESSHELPDTVGGTPEYLAPERLRGAPPHSSTDLYSLGVLSWQLLTGEVPFRGEVREVLEKQLRDDPPPIEEVRGEAVDERVGALIRRALAKEPAERQASTSAFLYELRTVTEMLGVRSRRPTMRGALVQDHRDGAEAKRRAAAFESAPFPMAGINIDGSISVANSQFVKFLTGDRSASLTDSGLLRSELVEIYPEFLRDLRRVHVRDSKLRKEVWVRADEGGRPLTFLMAPARRDDAGDVHVTVIAGALRSGGRPDAGPESDGWES